MDERTYEGRRGGILASLAVGAPVALSTSGAAAAPTTTRDPARAADLGRRPAPVRPRVVRREPPELRARQARRGAAPSSRNAHTSDPSDSDPGGTALMTGGDPRATGVYYDVEYNHAVYEAGTTTCTGPTGGDVIYDSPDDLDVTRLDAGQGIPGLRAEPGADHGDDRQPADRAEPGDVPGRPDDLPADLRRTPTCKVNTMFEVAKAAGMRTAWSDKHPVYESFNGPSGTRASTTSSRPRSTQRDRAQRHALSGRFGLDRRQRRDAAVRRLQGPGDHQRDRRLRPQRRRTEGRARRRSSG